MGSKSAFLLSTGRDRGTALVVRSEHNLEERSDAQIVVSRFPLGWRGADGIEKERPGQLQREPPPSGHKRKAL